MREESSVVTGMRKKKKRKNQSDKKGFVLTEWIRKGSKRKPAKRKKIPCWCSFSLAYVDEVKGLLVKTKAED